MTRGRKLITSSLFGVVDLVFQLGISFFMMPFLIHSLGDKQYGLWILVATFMGYYGLLDIGLSSAVSRFISRAIGQNDKNERKIIITTSFYTFLFLGIIAFIATLLCVYFAYIIVSSKDDLYLLRILLLIMGVSLCLAFPLRAFIGVISANLRHYISSLINIVMTIIRTLLIVYFVIDGFGLIAIAAITAGCSILSGLCLLFYAFKIEDAISISPTFFKRNRVKKLFGYSIYVFVGRIADILKYQIDSFVIAKFVTLTAVTHYGIALRLCQYFINLISRSVSIISPIFSQEEGKGNFESIRGKYLFTTKISSYLSMSVGIMILLYGRPFIERWMGQEYIDSFPVLVLLIIPSIIGMSQAPLFNVLYGISKHQIISYVNIGEGISNLILSLILVKYYGIIGVAIGTTIPQAITTIIIYPYYVCKVLKISLYHYYKSIITYFLISASSLIIFWYAVNAFIRPDYLNIIILCFFQSIICCSTIVFLGFSSNERMYLLNFIRKK